MMPDLTGGRCQAGGSRIPSDAWVSGEDSELREVAV